MATGKKYFWIKLKTDFMTSDKVDYLMSKTNGAEYVVLYQMLCMKCINTDGLLARKIGEVIIPFDAEKIQRDCKYFKIDTVREAFRLFIQLGMIYQEENGFLRIADFENMVGSETDWAAQKRNQTKKAINNINSEKLLPNSSGSSVESSVENFHTDIRERDRDNNIYIGAENLNSFSIDKDFTPMQQDYAKAIFTIWSNANLPCQRKNFISFIQKDFKDSISVIKDYHSDDIIGAVNNYVSVLKNPETWVDQELSFDIFVKTPKLFKMCLPESFRLNNFIKNKQNHNNSQNTYQNNKKIKPNLDDQSGWLQES